MFRIAFMILEAWEECLWIALTLKMYFQNISESIDNQSVQLSCSVVSQYLWLHGMQHARPLCPSPTPGAYSNLFPLSQWCHPTISFSVVPLSSHLQSFWSSGSFQMSQFVLQLAKKLEFQLQHQSFQWIFRTDFL